MNYSQHVDTELDLLFRERVILKQNNMVVSGQIHAYNKKKLSATKHLISGLNTTGRIGCGS